MKGVFYIDSKDKQLTNIRSALVVAEATDPTNTEPQSARMRNMNISIY